MPFPSLQKLTVNPARCLVFNQLLSSANTYQRLKNCQMLKATLPSQEQGLILGGSGSGEKGMFPRGYGEARKRKSGQKFSKQRA